jgi:hypothetical protein
MRAEKNSLRLALKAEALLGLHLVTRHRAPRLAAVLGLALVATAAASGSGHSPARPVLLIASTVAVVAASRLLAGGPALAAARMVAARWWVVPVGRLAGALCAVAPFTLGMAAMLAGSHGDAGPWRLAWVAGAYAAVLIACTMAMASRLGASAAATLGCFGVWLGGVPPSALSAMLAPWPLARQGALWSWGVLPLPWRALRWLAGGPATDPLLLMAWLVMGVTLAGWRLSPRSGT